MYLLLASITAAGYFAGMSDYLVIQLARIGDLIQSKRLVLTLERLGQVHLALDRGLIELAALLYPKARLHPLRVHAGADNSDLAVLTDNAVAFAELKQFDFAAVYNLNRSPLALTISGLFAPESVQGYRRYNGQLLCSDWSRLASRWTAQRQSSPINLVDFWAFFHPLAQEVISPGEVNPPACPKHAPGRDHVIGVVLAGRESRRSLPPDYLAACLEALFTARKGPRLILLGGKSEQEAARKLCRRLKPATLQRVEDLSGKTSLRDLHEIVQGLDLAVTPDTGAMHLAAHLGTPVLATFLSSAWAWETGPYGLGHQVWQAWQPQSSSANLQNSRPTANSHNAVQQLDCVPCLESAPCPHGVACLAAFASPAWLEHLAGRIGRSPALPQTIPGLPSITDQPNSACRPGTPDQPGPPAPSRPATPARPAPLGLVSRLDGLGVSYFAPDENQSAQFAKFARLQKVRLARRALLCEYLNLPAADIIKSQTTPEDLAKASADLFAEADWMLPDYR